MSFMWLDAFLLRTQSAGIGTIGDTLFKLYMGSEIKKGVLFVLPLTGVQRNEELPGMRKTSMQVIVRAASHQDTYDLGVAVNQALEIKQEIDMAVGTGQGDPVIRVSCCHPQNEPILFPKSDGGYVEASLNFDLTMYLPPSLA